MRYHNLYTGKEIMTEANTLRHFIKVGEKALKLNNLEKMKEIRKEASYHIDIDQCYKCKFDDIGYCVFRGRNSIDADKHFKICFENWINAMKEFLHNKYA